MKFIKNPFKYTKEFKSNETIMICYSTENVTKETLKKLGFTVPLVINEKIIPSISFNNKTKDNIKGEYIARLDLPRIDLYYESTHGYVDGKKFTIKNKKRKIGVARQYDHKEPYNISLSIKEYDNEFYICTNPMKNAEENKDVLKFAMNLMLSIFGDFTIKSEH